MGAIDYSKIMGIGNTQKANSATLKPTPVPTPTPVYYGPVYNGPQKPKPQNNAAPTGGVANYAPQQQQAQQQSGPSQDELINQQIDALYGQGRSLLDQQEGTVKSGYTDQESNLNSSIDNDISKYGTEQTNLLGDTDLRQNKYNKVIDTALQQAIRAYNALQQQNRAQYGFGSSAGQAIGELAQQEFFRQQGDIQGKQAEGGLQFEQERGRIKTYVTQKIDDLNQYKREALSQLKQNLQNSLNDIAARRYDLESNKTKDKMAVLQNAVSLAQGISAQDLQFRQQIASAALTKMQEVAGRAFTPQEITATLAEFGINMPQIQATAPAQGISQVYRPPTSNKDELKQTNPYAAQ